MSAERRDGGPSRAGAVVAVVELDGDEERGRDALDDGGWGAVAAVVDVVPSGLVSAADCVIHSPTVPATKAAPLTAAMATRDRAAGCWRRRRLGGGVEVPVGEDHGGLASPALTDHELDRRNREQPVRTVRRLPEMGH